MDSTYLSKLFYLLNLRFYLYHKKNSHVSNLKLIIKKKKNDELYSLIIIQKKKKKCNLQILHVTFCKYIYIYIYNLKNRKWSPKQLFLFLVFWKFFLKVGAKHVKYKNYYLKTSFKFNFLKIDFILFWKEKKNPTTN